ncbi:MAG: hypothetical protein JXR53_02840, partial [Bacteroidales bacterium]|nr:hypothetical protein [Bacteroidales bacterium]
GHLENLKAILVGHMTDMNDNEVPFGKTAEEIIADHCSKYDFPLFFNAPVGHERVNRPLIIGEKIEISTVGNQTMLKQ